MEAKLGITVRTYVVVWALLGQSRPLEIKIEGCIGQSRPPHVVCLAFTTSCMTFIFLGLFHWFLHALEAMELDYEDIYLELTRAYLNTIYEGQGKTKGGKEIFSWFLLDS